MPPEAVKSVFEGILIFAHEFSIKRIISLYGANNAFANNTKRKNVTNFVLTFSDINAIIYT